ncbi:MAG TPA: DUF6065 family protein [Gemmatimonadota bacterium]|nr:DUF6065 family protein [Gemmatimonadota bacterium]
MKLECLLRDDVEMDIRPSSNRREWMDATDERYAYRCLPLSMANAHGWVICCGGSFEAEWNGGDAPQDVHVTPLGDGEIMVDGHFGYGILTFSPRGMFRTEPGYNLWVSGPPNQFKDGIQPLTAMIETDWMPYTFSMNWKITRAHLRIRFDKGEPYCFLFPIKRGLTEEVEPALRRTGDDPESERQLDYAGRMRNFLKNVKSMRTEQNESEEVRNAKALNFQMWYMKGQMPDGSNVFEEHQKRLELRPFADLRHREQPASPGNASREASES